MDDLGVHYGNPHIMDLLIEYLQSFESFESNHDGMVVSCSFHRLKVSPSKEAHPT